MNSAVAYLKQKREEAGLSQGQLARALGYSSPQFVSNWERGINMPPLKKLKKICKVLGLSALMRQHLFDQIIGVEQAKLLQAFGVKNYFEL